MLVLERHLHSDDGSHQLVWKLEDGHMIESGIVPRESKQRKKQEPWTQAEDEAGAIPAMDRYTACISSQCSARNLTKQEIIDQVRGLQKFKPISRVDFSGMGEPLLNIDAVIEAIRYFKSPRGLKLSKRKMGVHTTGDPVSALLKLSETGVGLVLSVSEMPDSRQTEIMSAALDYGAKVKQTVLLEYKMIKGVNDTLLDQERLYQFARDWDCKINLISNSEAIKEFQRSLVSRGINAVLPKRAFASANTIRAPR